MDLTKIESLICSAQARLRQAEDTLDEVRALLHDEPTQGMLAKELVLEFCKMRRQQARYVNSPYVIANWPKALTSMRKALKVLPAEELTARMARYLNDRDPFYVNAGHPLEVFMTVLNKLAVVETAR